MVVDRGLTSSSQDVTQNVTAQSASHNNAEDEERKGNNRDREKGETEGRVEEGGGEYLTETNTHLQDFLEKNSLSDDPEEHLTGTDEHLQVILENKSPVFDDLDIARGTWQSQCDYFLSLAGFAIGLSNVWRFPYLCYMNGGGAFLVPYLLVLVLVGIPLYRLESSLGQFSSCSCFTLYEVCPLFKGVGVSSFLVNVVFVTVYSVVIAYPLLFLYNSFNSHLPWSSCDNPWNTPACSLTTYGNTSKGNAPELSPADEFFHNYILEITGGITELGGFTWPVMAATVFIWVFVFLCVFKGIKVFGKVVWFTATFPFVMLFVMLIRGLTLPGAWNGIYFYIYPDFEKLKDLRVWAAAAGQIFYSLGPGWGILTTLGSYNKFRYRCQRDAIFVPVLNCATSILAGFVVFSVLGFIAHRSGVSVQDVTSAGPALVFITYPEALSLMPFAPFWAVLFFLTIFFLGIDSLIAHIETTTMSLVDKYRVFGRYRGLVTLAVCVLAALASLIFCTRGGIYWLTLVDWYSASFTLVLNSLCEVLVFSFIYGAGRTVRDLQMMTSERIGYYWYAVWLLVTPLVLLLIFINIMVSNAPASYRGEVFPGWVQALGWFSALVSIVAVPAYFVYYITCASRGTLTQRVSTGLQPSKRWGPLEESYRKEWEVFCLQHPLRHRLLHPDLTLHRPMHQRKETPCCPVKQHLSLPLLELSSTKVAEV
ncbi:sodium- and chloride-dependent GABA transporter 1-like isoform X1 [Cherax quadricarinatus]|uniref:sodium- and chloride-dependent GABA transporter 1-like isoform X1 n=1 Tax=Cherax quadricarinatus TaxID=27406 RepID=UPI00387E65F5